MEALDLSQSSKFCANPLTDILQVLGRRSLSFPDLAHLKFMAIMTGGAVWLCPGRRFCICKPEISAS
ncbi:hypothetical protein SAMN05216224_102457 [Thioclava dalianensis]|nr:hypothetical protein SAMN05216224_102457 [Thioclava dalianensis]